MKKVIFSCSVLVLVILSGSTCFAELPPATTCSAPYVWNTATSKCEVAPTCTAGTYNAATDRCEQAATPHFACSMGGDYATSQACTAGCHQSAACQLTSITGSGSFGGAINITGSGSCLVFHDEWAREQSVCFSGLSFSGSIQAGDIWSTPMVISLLASGGGTQIVAYFQETICIWGCGYIIGQGQGAISVSGGTVIGGDVASLPEGSQFGYLPSSGSAYGNQLAMTLGFIYSGSEPYYFPGTPLTFTSTTSVCPLGNYACSGGSCTATGNCTGPTFSCTAGWSLSGSTCYAAMSCPSTGTLNASTDKCEMAGRTPAPGTYYQYDALGRVKTIMRY